MRILNGFIKLLVLFFAMVMMGGIGYFIAKKSIPQPKEEEKSTETWQYNPTEEYSDLSLPVDVTEAYPEEASPVADDDYLVISCGNLVSLYIINKEGEKIFNKVLDIDIDSLREEDRTRLCEGIVLRTREELLTLIEDYSS